MQQVETVEKKFTSPTVFYELFRRADFDGTQRFSVKAYFEGDENNFSCNRCSVVDIDCEDFIQAESFVSKIAGQAILPSHLEDAANDMF